MRRKRLKFPAKIILTCLLSGAVLLFLALSLLRYLLNSDYFKIKDSPYFSGKSIFKLDLNKEARRLSQIYPDYQIITIKRFLPDRITVDFLRRRAIAILQLSEDFYVDAAGVLFCPDNEQEEDLPIVRGLQKRIAHPQIGVKYNDKFLQAALNFIEKINQDKNLTRVLSIREVNLANPNDIFIVMHSGSQIKLGGVWSLNKDLSILQRLLNQIPDLAKVEYIDLRFKEPVVKYK